MTGSEFVVYALAVWRLTSLISKERGPFDIFVRLRRSVGILPAEDGSPLSWSDQMPANLIVCPWCLSVWIGVIWVIAIFINPEIMIWISLPLSLSAVAILIQSGVGKE